MSNTDEPLRSADPNAPVLRLSSWSLFFFLCVWFLRETLVLDAFSELTYVFGVAGWERGKE